MPQLDTVPRPAASPLGAPGERWGAIDPPELPLATVGLGVGNVFVRNEGPESIDPSTSTLPVHSPPAAPPPPSSVRP